MSLRLATALILALGAAASAGQAMAQYARPDYPPPPGAIYADEDDDGDVIRPPAVQSEALPPPGGSAPGMAPPVQAAPPPPDAAPAGYPSGPVDLSARYPASATYAPAPDSGMRPPADVSGTTASVPVASAPGAPVAPGAAPAGDAGVETLPPDYQPEQGTPKQLPPYLRRQVVEYWTKEPPGTIIVDTPNTYLYLVLSEGKAMRYGIGVGREGFTWAGREKITRMAEWPDWYPPPEMITRQPYLPRFMAGGESNPLGARALYLGNTEYRIHGTNQPSTIGTFVSSGCIRLTNEDIEDLYQRVKVGTKVVVLPGNPPPPTAARPQQPTPVAAAAAPGPQAR